MPRSGKMRIDGSGPSKMIRLLLPGARLVPPVVRPATYWDQPRLTRSRRGLLGLLKLPIQISQLTLVEPRFRFPVSFQDSASPYRTIGRRATELTRSLHRYSGMSRLAASGSNLGTRVRSVNAVPTKISMCTSNALDAGGISDICHSPVSDSPDLRQHRILL